MKHMYKKIFLLLTILFFVGCSKEESNPVIPDTVQGFILCLVNFSSWSADELQAYRQQNTLYLKGRKSISGNHDFTFSEIDLKIINLNQPGTFGIGENEPGFQYFVKGNYTLKSSNRASDKVYTAYYLDYSLLKINSISTNSIEADFVMKLFNEDFSDSLLITNGRLNIDF